MGAVSRFFVDYVKDPLVIGGAVAATVILLPMLFPAFLASMPFFVSAAVVAAIAGGVALLAKFLVDSFLHLSGYSWKAMSLSQIFTYKSLPGNSRFKKLGHYLGVALAIVLVAAAVAAVVYLAPFFAMGLGLSMGIMGATASLAFLIVAPIAIVFFFNAAAFRSLNNLVKNAKVKAFERELDSFPEVENSYYYILAKYHPNMMRAVMEDTTTKALLDENGHLDKRKATVLAGKIADEHGYKEVQVQEVSTTTTVNPESTGGDSSSPLTGGKGKINPEANPLARGKVLALLYNAIKANAKTKLLPLKEDKTSYISYSMGS